MLHSLVPKVNVFVYLFSSCFRRLLKNNRPKLTKKCKRFANSVSGVNSRRHCGRMSSGTTRIINGQEVGGYMYPWYVAIQEHGITICGGTLIANGLVLSAAHCFLNSRIVYTAKLGVYDVCRDERHQRKYDVDDYYIHEKYASQDPFYDIALVIVNGDTSNYEPVCLPDRILNDISKGELALIMGLGDIYVSRINKDQQYRPKDECKLRSALIKLYSDDVCNELFKSHRLRVRETQSKAFCAGFLEDGPDVCEGDSGGPLVATDRDGSYFLLGVVSFGWGCAESGSLSVYMDVSHFIEWIKEVIQDESGKYVIFKNFVAEFLH